MREFEEEDALTVAQLEAGVRCKWRWSWLKLESKCDVKGICHLFTPDEFAPLQLDQQICYFFRIIDTSQ